MNALRLMDEARRQNVALWVDCGLLRFWCADKGLSADLRCSLATCRADVVALLLAPLNELQTELWEERSAVREYGGEMPREMAERIARLDVLCLSSTFKLSP